VVPATLKFRCHIAAIRDRRHWVDTSPWLATVAASGTNRPTSLTRRGLGILAAVRREASQLIWTTF
jgi:hypothetical protein